MTRQEIMDWIKVDKEAAHQIIKTMVNGESVDEQMETINTLMDGFGVEGIQVDGSFIADYVNTGDTYSNTIAYLHDTDEFVLSTWGDIFEEYSNKAREDILEELAGESVSWDTMREEDLIPAFMGFLEDLNCRLVDAHCGEIDLSDIQKEVDALEIIEDHRYGDYYADKEEASYVLHDLFDLIDEYAPEGYYFGAHPGNGSDYGFWPVEEDYV